MLQLKQRIFPLWKSIDLIKNEIYGIKMDDLPKISNYYPGDSDSRVDLTINILTKSV